MPTADPIVSAIVEKYRNNPTYVLQILREAQEALDWISPETVETVASGLKIPRTRVQSVLQFYSFLYDKPRGRYRLLFADNITDRMAGNIALFEHMLSRLKLKRGVVSSDGLVSVDLTSDTGMCDQGPALLANNRAIPRLTMRRIDEICDLVKARAPLDEWPADCSASTTTSAAARPC
jgi:[NiFe] hydrogenase diaphorase moiety large subunit